MKDKKHLLLKLLCFTFMLGSTAAGAAACKAKPTEPSIPEGYDKTFTGVGSYYAGQDATTNTFELTDSTFTLKLGEQTIGGTYLFNGTVLRLVTSGGTIIEATYSDAAIRVTYAGTTYTFIKNVQYTVSFEMNGGSAQADVKVLNGQKLDKAALGKPTKGEEGDYAFIGWYKDAAHTEKYSFDQPVTKNMKLYAYFVQLFGTEEYTITFAGYTGAGFPGKTTGRKLFDLPALDEKDGAAFAGWWYSAYNDGDKLTAQYKEGDSIYENLVLYPVWRNSEVPAVSVGEKEISWTSLGVNKSYEVTVAKITEDGEEQTVGQTATTSLAYAFDFAAQEAGDYVITVKNGNNETKAYYKNKTLARVCLFAVKYPSVFTFGGVEGAVKYLLTYECGTGGHEHEEIDLGTETFYDFSGCAMKEGGITFTVTAVAGEGYRGSVSATYTFDGSLATPENFVLDETNEKLSWNAVKFADCYLLTINGGDEIYLGTKTEFDLKGYAKGDYEFALVAVGAGFNNSVAATATWTKNTLAAPEKPALDGYKLTWNAVEGATGYVVKIGGRTIDTTTNEYTFTASDFAANKTYAISVCAKGGTAEENSLFSETITLTTAAELNPEYSNGTLTWNGVVGATKYQVQVNGENVVDVRENSAKITLTMSGANVLRVRVYNEAGVASEWSEITVTAYTVSYDVGESEQKVADRYFAAGDEIALPEPDFNGYDFAGWYDGENGEGKKYEAVYGSLPVFDDDANLTLYAKWQAKTYRLNLNGGTYNASDLSAGATVKYRQSFSLPVPQSNDSNRAFLGWYYGTTQLTDEQGESKAPWSYLGGADLTARWAEIFVLESTLGGYTVKKPSTGISYVTEVTVPATYKGKPVLTIGAEAFADCKKLVSINIPNSISTIEIAAFSDCSALTSVKIYEVEGVTDPVYYSPATEENGKTVIDGVIVKNDATTGKTLFFVPQAKAGNNGEYTIPDGVETISQNVFSGRNQIKKLNVPASVTNVISNGFAKMSYLEEVTFLAAAENAEEKALFIDELAFESCYRMTRIVLPARLSAMTLYDGTTQSVFKGCSRLAEIEVTGNAAAGAEKTYSSARGMLLSGDGRTLAYYPVGKEDTEVSLPDSVTRIGEKAFLGNTKITKFAVPARVTEIGAYAFMDCTKLAELTFEGDAGDADLAVREKAFYNCSALTALTIAQNVRTIESQAFGFTRNLTEVTVNSTGAVNFANGAFVNDNGSGYVQTLRIGEGLSGVDISAVFGGEGSALATVTVDAKNEYYYEGADGVIYDKNLDEAGQTNLPTKILYYPVLKEGEYVVPETVTSIGANVFAGRKKLTKVTIGANITAIGSAAFKNCYALTEVVWGAAAEGAEAKALKIGDNAFNSCDGLTAFVLPARVTSIGEGSFGDCDGLTSFTFEASTGELEIGARAFYSCDALTAIELREGVVSVGNGAFSNCKKLERVKFPATAERLGEWEKVTGENGKPDTYTFVGMDLFKSSSNICTNLASVEVAEGNKRYASKDGMLFGKYEKENDESSAGDELVRLYFCPFAKTGAVQLPNTLIEIYKEAFAYNAGVTSVRFAGELTHEDFDIGENALYNAKALATFELPNGLKEIKTGLFKGCSQLLAIVIPNTVSLMKAGAFEGCSLLSTVTFADGNDTNPLVLEDGTRKQWSGGSSTSNTYQGAFSYVYKSDGYDSSYSNLSCLALTSITFPKRLSSIGAYAFYGCENLATVNFGADSLVGTIGDSAFMNTALSAVKLGETTETQAEENVVRLPASLRAIRAQAFYNTKFAAHTTFMIPANVTDFGEDTISAESATTRLGQVFEKTNVESVIFENNSLLTKVHWRAFAVSSSGEKALTTVKFGDNSALETIENGAFSGQSKLTTVDFGKNSKLKTIGGNAFSSCTGLQRISIPASIEELQGKGLYGGTFYECTALKQVIFETYEETNEETGAVEGKSSLKKIGDRAFEKAGLTSFTFPSTLEVLDTGALGAELFKDCKKLETVNISDTVKDITKVFDYCGSIKNVNLPETGGYFKAEGPVIYNTEGNEITYVLGDMPETFTVSDNVTTLKASVFAGKATLKKIIIPANVTTIEEKAFYDCIGLETVEFAENSALTTIGASAFRNCVSLKSISIPSNVATLNPYTFYNCRSLTSVTLPKNLTRIGYYAYNGAEKLGTSGGYVFAHCENLATINLPEGLQWIQPYSFLNCKSLKTLNLNVANGQLGESAFAHCEGLEQVTLCEGLKTLPNNAFRYCYALKNVLGSGAQETEENTADLTQITSFGSYAFAECASIVNANLSTDATLKSLSSNLFDGCTSLEYVNKTKTGGTDEEPVYISHLPDQLTYLSSYTFRNTGLKRVRLPDGVVTIGTSATNIYTCALTSTPAVFDGCTNLTYVDLNNVTRIGGLTFRNCPLTEVAGTVNGETGEITGELDLSKVTVFGLGAFAGTGLKKVNLSGVWLKSTGSAASNPPAGFGDGKSGSGDQATVTSSGGEGVFENCTQLKEVIFSDKTGKDTWGTSTTQKTVKVELGKQMFKNCTALEKVKLPASATSTTALPAQVFYGCTALKDVNLNGATPSSMGDYAFGKCASLESIDLSTVTMTSIAAGAFDGCVKLADVRLNSEKIASITAINNYAFRNCISLVSEVPENVPEGAKISAFSLKEMTALKTIGTGAFQNCTKLKSVELPTMTNAPTTSAYRITIGASAFSGCSNLETVTLSRNVYTINTSAFGHCAKLKTVTAAGNDFFTAQNGLLKKADGTIVWISAAAEFENDTVALGENDKLAAGALDGCTNIKKLVLPESMTSIAAKFFADASNLEEVVISSQTTEIGANAFDGSNLKKITYNGYTESGEETLKTSVFPATLKTIGDFAFKNTQLEKVIIPETLNGVEYTSSGVVNNYSIKKGAFSGSALQSVVIEGSETYFAKSATLTDGVFANCVNLTDVKFMKDTSQFGSNMFAGCTALETVVLPANTTALGEYMFRNCSALKSITIPDTVTELPYQVFAGTGLTEIDVPASVIKINSWAFSGCANLSKVTLHEGLHELGSKSFENCTSLTQITLPETVTKVDGFLNCTNLQSINIPSSVETISSDAFGYCTSLKSIVIPASITKVGFAFVGWTTDQTIYIEKSPSEVYNQWQTDNDGGYFWLMNDYGFSLTSYFYPCAAKVVWNYDRNAATTETTESTEANA